MTLAIVMAAAAVLVIIDQVIKYFVVENLAPSGSVSVIDNLFSLTYVENRGVAFGMFQNHVWLFAILTILLIAVFIWLILSKKLEGKLFLTAAALMIGGGIGNLIDRIWRGFVVDYLSLSFFSPVCNFADYCITIGAFLFVIVILFFSGKDKKQPKTEIAAEADKNEETDVQKTEEEQDTEKSSEKEESRTDNSGEEDGE